ncbi:MAG TPA: CopD family protein [Acidocella sp.]|nr:CopD family protein [Acidocella sp.]
MEGPAWTLLRGLCRGLNMAGSFGVFGTIFLSATLLRGEKLAGLKRLAWSMLALALLAGGVWFVLQTADFAAAQSWSDITAAAPIVVQDTRFGALLLGRGAALLLAVLIFQWGFARPAALLALAGTLAESWLGHGGAMTGTIGLVLLLASLAHLASGAAWLGSLPALHLALRRLPPAAAARLAQNFSPLGIACVAALIVTAGVQSYLLIGTPLALLTSSYGLIALVKFLLLGGLIALAAQNRASLTPALPATRAQLLRNINLEIALGLVVLLAAGLILQFGPPAMAAMAPGS